VWYYVREYEHKGEVKIMAYESKALLVAVLRILATSEDMKDAYEAIAEMATADGTKIKTYEEATVRNEK